MHRIKISAKKASVVFILMKKITTFSQFCKISSNFMLISYLFLIMFFFLSYIKVSHVFLAAFDPLFMDYFYNILVLCLFGRLSYILKYIRIYLAPFDPRLVVSQ